MNFDPNALINFLPQFLIGGLIAIYFYATFKKFTPGGKEGLMFQATIPQVTPFSRSHPDSGGISTLDSSMSRSLHFLGATKGNVDYSLYSSPIDINYIRANNDRASFLGDTQLILLTIDLWILIALLLSPIKTVSQLMPTLPGFVSSAMFLLLASVLGIAILTTVVSRIDFNRKTLGILVIAAGGVTLGSFYAPAMQWVGGLNGLIHLVVVYSAVVIACMGVYAAATYMRKKPAFSTSAYTSFTSYGITAFILLFNLIRVAF